MNTLKYASLLFAILWLFSSCVEKKQLPSDAFYMPAEYEEHAAVWLGWVKYDPYIGPFLDIAQSLYEKVPIKVITYSDEALASLKDTLNQIGLDTNRFSYQIMADNRLWMRDHGATYLVNELGEKRVVDFNWSMYGMPGVLHTLFEGNQDSINLQLEDMASEAGIIDSLMGAIEGHSPVKTDVIMEGGSIEVNGEGTLILCEDVTFQRNPDLSRAHIESEFKRVLGVSNIIWMKSGLVEDALHFAEIIDGYYGYGTFGHTDEFVRFANDSTIFLAWVEEEERALHPINELNYQRMSENLQILEDAKDQDGKPFTVIKVPLPNLMYMETTVAKDGKSVNWKDRSEWQIPAGWIPKHGVLIPGEPIKWVAASSYMNYLVTNGAVLLPTYVAEEGASEEKEEKVKSIFSEVFPNRELIFLDVMKLNYHGGGIHCVTQQEPVSP
ncbi:MAG: agmatine deiminase family protein [Bacteroidota bacterium]